ncbi:hypothetical protein L596_026077 [Steinernema carpocapsae]|uniref:EGF-like domain-containing protein n=1 Tax=Steinernema carpocapsae TaxID=34508 RepID=A0A4U5M0B9_STECR|nr:hypothetical protein L596_026077 [Steinernema carpocapsae]
MDNASMWILRVRGDPRRLGMKTFLDPRYEGLAFDSKTASMPFGLRYTVLSLKAAFQNAFASQDGREGLLEKIDACKEHFCVNDAKCIDDGIGGYSCECEPDYAGDYCESPKPAILDATVTCFMDTVKCANNSTCWPGNPDNTDDEDDYKCICRPGFIGKYCEDELPCAITNPCKNGGECYRENGKAVCECLSIWTGDFCKISTFVTIANPTESMSQQYDLRSDRRLFQLHLRRGNNREILRGRQKRCEVEKNGVALKNRCATKDKGAKCNRPRQRLFVRVFPEVGRQGVHHKRDDWELLKNFKSYNDDTVKMLEDILEKPELIKETVPFFLALFSQEHQANISWDHEDMFTYASFEGRELDISKDLVQWNAATLGNCFTFNHDSRSEKMTLR